MLATVLFMPEKGPSTDLRRGFLSPESSRRWVGGCATRSERTMREGFSRQLETKRVTFHGCCSRVRRVLLESRAILQIGHTEFSAGFPNMIAVGASRCRWAQAVDEGRKIVRGKIIGVYRHRKHPSFWKFLVATATPQNPVRKCNINKEPLPSVGTTRTGFNVTPNVD